ncbi:MAG: sulfatase [Planctomycetota bacterium]
MKPIHFASVLLTTVAMVFGFGGTTQANDHDRPNLLIVTVDDMSCDSVGAFGCQLEGTTPNIDRLAKKSLRYKYAHVQVGNCYPSRNVMWSGRYPHNTGVEGFYQIRNTTYPHLVDSMKEAGYFVGIRGKVSHSTPYQPYAWDADLTTLDGERQHTKNPKSYFDSTLSGIEMAEAADKPFCLNINISDPHKPFFGVDGKGNPVDDPFQPSRIYQADEVPVPGFLFDHPAVRKELALYYSSVRRADDCFGQIMKALETSGQQENTIVMFLSDHGMPLPFAKTALWHHSTRTPLIIHWPGVTKPDTVDDQHVVSAVDFMPTILDMIGQPHPKGYDGRSFIKTIRGQTQPDRDSVYKVYNENSGANRSPMRAVDGKKFGYLFNAWSDEKRVFRTATTGTATYRTMVELAESNPQIADRLKHFKHSTPEEFYDYENDPDALNNLIDDPKYAKQIEAYRQKMRQYMVQSNDPILEAFDSRSNPEVVSQYVDKVQAAATARRAKSRKNRNKKNNKK